MSGAVRCPLPIVAMLRALAVIALGFGASANAQEADPPGRVGRVAHVEGDVQFQNTHSGESAPAQVNWPVTGRNVILTGADGRAEVRVGSTAIRIDRDAEVEFARLDDAQVRVRLIAGRMALQVRNPEKLREVEVRTPHGLFVPERVGLFRIDTRGAGDSSGVAAFSGSGRLESGDRVTAVASGQHIEVTGTPGHFEVRAGPLARDGFDEWSIALDQAGESPYAARHVSPEMTGHEMLDRHGEWRTDAEHGALWVPHAAALPPDWAPYRWGRWAWIDPWGWTWVDAAPWGFAPSHYGRWVHNGSYWGWAPGPRMARPVYAPALVGWVGAPGMSVAVASGPAVGWFPLGPGEAFHPYYRYSPGYLNWVNRGVVVSPPPAPVVGAPVVPPGSPVAGQARWRHATLPQAVTLVPSEVMSNQRAITPSVAAPRGAQSVVGVPVSPAATTFAPPPPALQGTWRRPGERRSPGIEAEPVRNSNISPSRMHAPAPVAPATSVVPFAASRNMTPAPVIRSAPSIAPVPGTSPAPMIRHAPVAPLAAPTPAPVPRSTLVPAPVPRTEAPRFESPRTMQRAPMQVAPPVMHTPRTAPHSPAPAATPHRHGGQVHQGGNRDRRQQ